MTKWMEWASWLVKPLIVAAAFSLALSTAYLSVVMSLFFLAWMASGGFAEKFRSIRANPGAMTAVALVLLYALGMLYSSADWESRWLWLLKYHKLLYIPLIVSVLDDETWRRRALDAFLAGMLLVLLLSYLKLVNILPHQDIGQGYIVFKGRIAHGIFMAFALYLLLHRAHADRKWRWFWIMISILAAANILFMVNGRTGQVVMMVLLLWFVWEKWGGRSVKWLGGVVLVVAALYPLLPDLPLDRLVQIHREIQQHDSTDVQQQTSSGQRIDFYRTSIKLISRHPVFGGGTGSFEKEYLEYAEANNFAQKYVPNPHNEYLLVSQELGLIGLAALIYFWWGHWRQAAELSCHYQAYFLRGLVLTISVGSLFNSLLLDAGEGKFYCVLAGVLLSGWRTPAEGNA